MSKDGGGGAILPDCVHSITTGSNVDWTEIDRVQVDILWSGCSGLSYGRDSGELFVETERAHCIASVCTRQLYLTGSIT